ncbi:hypothetical protein CFR72_14255 [Gluconacetobacter entanii]|uniref:Uncharacterized protein n=1 Tax=Gluconacetobacter entanii TaxID=108528 RepID=A0A318PNN3_9PROT|nr:hypothetical protein CFR72_14255 [Gluconacetobacter entanii]
MGSSDGGTTILYIVYTVQEAENSDEEDYGRIVSVRKAKKDECEKYRNKILQYGLINKRISTPDI